MSLGLFLFKIAVPPVLVAAMSVIARVWGPTVGGLIMGLPWMTGPVLFFLALDKGPDFAVAACLGIQLGVLCIAGYILGFYVGSLVGPWPIALAAATLGFGSVAVLVREFDLPLWGAALAGTAALLMVYMLIRAPRGDARGGALPWWDIPARMAVTFALVAGIMTMADRLGPTLSGIISTFPVILTVIGSFTYHQWGREALLRVLRGISISLVGFVIFFLVVGYTLPAIGLVPAFAAAALSGVTFSASTVWFSRRR
jgi:hypothetical protein